MADTDVKKIKKRDGRIVDFDKEKITDVIFKAAESVGGKDRKIAEELSAMVADELNAIFDGKKIPTVEEVQDTVEKVLMKTGHAKTAKEYILYRQKRSELRAEKTAVMGRLVETKLSVNALKVLSERYLRKDNDGNIIETPNQLFRRVARNIASADRKHGAKEDEAREVEQSFYEMMANLDFLPNSPTLMNAGNEIQQLSACFVLPVGDSMEEIFDAIKNTALIHKSGGGTGFSFSRLRPKSDRVKSTKGVSSGPLSFMKVFDAATDVIKQGGKRRGANMGILRVDHPDVMDFIVAKEKDNVFNNFNFSVALTEKFMKALEKDKEFEFLNPRTKEAIRKVPARGIFDLIVMMAWKNGDPGIVFIDEINKYNPTPNLGEIESTNPCGEQPLLPYESCNLGSINLANFVRDGEVDYEKLRKIIHQAVHFLDNVIDMNSYPIDKIKEQTLKTRKIGLGVMGWADMLFQLDLAYDSEEALKLAEKVMKFIDDEAMAKSAELAKERGVFPAFKGSIYDTGKKEDRVRNATRTTIAPTGTISMIADVASGVEPLFAISFIKRVMDGQDLLYTNKYFEIISREKGFYSEDLLKKIANKGSLHSFDEIPKSVKKVYVTAHDVTPEWHVRMQAAFQKYTNNAVSKTVNFPHSATTRDVENVYMQAYKLKCKGVTVYRDRSRGEQVLNIDVTDAEEKKAKKKEEKKEEQRDEICPECGSKLKFESGCATCPSCGYSYCS
ncbi:ribonucleoside-diphosphate reductase, adenosylcobalamin-dependent [Candidatus Woesearchaeota archaeon CG10_big_fil_rev_8_21_14_0_10_44_13]|nr:MAG: ribonucleoside-diphosphate reductase, adenosylcobalamin-dependent [Candidatus Woesearchaeota archaeon CG10_big_fil_rev_8_21_14_0_10_44_13]